MDLKTYLREVGVNALKMAEELGVNPQNTYRWANRERVPGSEAILAIARWSNGAVGPEDWFPEAGELARRHREHTALIAGRAERRTAPAPVVPPSRKTAP